MKLLALLFQLVTVYYVASSSSSPAGSDSNAGTQAAPWLTVQHSVNNMACGDTLTVVADGHFMAGDANLPAFSNCGQTTTIQSSLLNLLAPSGYRTNPANDSAAYGKLTFTSQGIAAAPAIWTFNSSFSYAGVSFNTSTSVVTIANGNGLTYPNLANGSVVELEVSLEAASYGQIVYPAISAPGGLTYLQPYYVINCGSGPAGSAGHPQTCGQVNSQFQLSLTSGGSAVSIASCGAGSYCAQTVATDPSGSCTLGSIQYNTTDSTTWGCANGSSWAQSNVFQNFGATTFVNLSANTLTMPNNGGTGTLANGMGLTFSSAGFNVYGTLPAPLQLNTVYYVESLSGLTFKLAATPGGTPIALTSAGTGMISVSSAMVPSNWAFRGLEMLPNGTNSPFYFLEFGNGSETSLNGMVTGMEVDRCYLHDNPPTRSIVHAVLDDGRYISIHDSWIVGANDGEAQAIAGIESPGPTSIQNNFLEAAGEVTLYGGGWSPYGGPNQYKLFQGNYFYKPPIWKSASSAVTPSGACLYDATDPLHAGGEWVTDTATSTNYQCTSGFTWATTVSTPPSAYTLKDMTEHKNGSHFSYLGNLYNYSFTGAQSGEAWNNSTEYGSGPGAANDNITVMNNAVYNVFQAMERVSQCSNLANTVCPVLPGNHVQKNNLIVVNNLACGVGFDTNTCGSSAGATQSTPGGFNPYFSGDTWNHNTIWTPDSYPFAASLTPIYASSPTEGCGPFTPLPYTANFFNSIMPGDFRGDCSAAGPLLALYYTNSNFAANVLKGATGSYSSVGATNTWSGAAFPTTNTSIGYVNGTGALGGDYHLASTSPYSAQNASPTMLSTDGTDVGADIDAINQATGNVIAGTPPPSARVTAGSVNALIDFTAPTAAACSTGIYPYPGPRNAHTLIGSAIADTIQDGLGRQTTIPSLTASTNYWASISCAGGWICVGWFTTMAAGTGSKKWQFQSSTSTPMEQCADPGMTTSCGSLGSGTLLAASVSAGGLSYVGIGSSAPYSKVRGIIAP